MSKNLPLHIESFFETKSQILLTVDEALNEWGGEGCYQFPSLLGQIKLKMNWDDKQLRANDPIIREYIRNHPNWVITRGAHGGIMKRADMQKKVEARSAKEKAKADLMAEIEAQVAQKKSAAETEISADEKIEETE